MCKHDAALCGGDAAGSAAQMAASGSLRMTRCLHSLVACERDAGDSHALAASSSLLGRAAARCSMGRILVGGCRAGGGLYTWAQPRLPRLLELTAGFASLRYPPALLASDDPL